MAQHQLPNFTQDDPEGGDLAVIWDNWSDAVETGHSGAVRPGYAQPGMPWTFDGGGGDLRLMFYNGTADFEVYHSGSSGVLRRLVAGAALPTSDIGPIWHDGYQSIMTWQVFDQNGADYTGYASQFVGKFMPDSQPVARAGHVKSSGIDLGDASYPALRAWAQHHGLMVPIAGWASGPFHFGDNGDGTFRTPDIRAETVRLYDDGRGLDVGRAFGDHQMDAFQGHVHVMRSGTSGGSNDNSRFSRKVTSAKLSTSSSVVSGGYGAEGGNGAPRTAAETRSRNFTQLGIIKF